MVADGVPWLQMAAKRPVGFCLVTDTVGEMFLHTGNYVAKSDSKPM